MRNRWMAAAGGASTALAARGAFGQQPEPWRLGLQSPASPVMANINDFHNMLLVIIALIAGVVLLLLVYVMWRFRAARNPQPSRTTHNTLVEILWTVIPISILVVIAVPSFNLLYFADRVQDPDMTIKVTGSQWYWTYQYPDQQDITFASNMKADDELAEGEPRLLAVDNELVLPVGADIQILVTASDVLHSFAVPALGLKMDAVPGRLNETWARIEAPGVYYGQCSELCGKDHSFMPIAIRAVPQDEFDAWVAERYADMGVAAPDDAVQVADLSPETSADLNAPGDDAAAPSAAGAAN